MQAVKFDRQTDRQTDRQSNIRQSGVELLKIIAMIMIIISHVTQSLEPGMVVDSYNIELKNSTQSIAVFILIIFRYFGQIGNAIFIVCSSWFLADSKKSKPMKIINIVTDTWFISWIILVVFLLLGINVGFNNILLSIAPILTGVNWFIPCYLIFYISHPIINRTLDALTKKQFFIFALIAFIYVSLITVYKGGLQYSNLLGFYAVYIIVVYMKRYTTNFSNNIKLNRIYFWIAVLLIVTLIEITNFLGMRVEFFNNRVQHWRQFINPLIILMAITLFNIFRNKKFRSKVINVAASTSLMVYVIHENALIREYFRPAVWKYLYNTFKYDHIIFLTLTYSAVMFITSLAIALLYKHSFRKLITKYCDWICEKVKKLCNELVDFCMNKLQ